MYTSQRWNTHAYLHRLVKLRLDKKEGKISAFEVIKPITSGYYDQSDNPTTFGLSRGGRIKRSLLYMGYVMYLLRQKCLKK